MVAALCWLVGSLSIALTPMGCPLGPCGSVAPALDLNVRGQIPLIAALAIGVFVKHARVDVLRRRPVVVGIMVSSFAVAFGCLRWADALLWSERAEAPAAVHGLAALLAT